MDAGSCFKGPMAKQHRMAVLTISLLLTPISILVAEQNYALFLALLIITIGSLLTVINRTYTIYATLEGK